MDGLYILLGVPIFLLTALMLWFIPHVMHRQAEQFNQEVRQIRRLVERVCDDHSVAVSRQAQVLNLLAHVQDQIDQGASPQPMQEEAPTPLRIPTRVESRGSKQKALLNDIDNTLDKVRGIAEEVIVLQERVRTAMAEDDMPPDQMAMQLTPISIHDRP